MEQDEGDIKDVWDDLALYGEGLLDSEIEVPELGSITLGDRLVAAFLSGFLPLLLLNLAAALLIAKGDYQVMALSLVASPVLGWVLGRLVRSEEGASGLKISLYVLPILLGNCLLSLASATMFHSLAGNPIHLEQLAWSFQTILESCLGWSLLAYLGLGLLLGAAIPWVKRSYPWIDSPSFQTRDRWWSTYPLLALLLLATISFVLILLPSKSTSLWRTQSSQRFLALPFGQLPDDGPEQLWRERDAEINRRIEAASGDPYGGSTPQDRQKALADYELNLDWETELPTSRRELRSALNYFPGVVSGQAPPEIVHLKAIKLRLTAQPIHGDTDLSSLIEYFLLPAVLKSELDEDGLLGLLRELEEAQSFLKSPMETLDLAAYWLLWEAPHTLHHGDSSLGWQARDSWRSPKMSYIMWDYRGNPRPRDLKILHLSWKWSPTHLVALYNRWKLSRDWLELQAGLEKADPLSHKDSFVEKSKGQYGANQIFWRKLATYATAEQSRRLLQTTKLVLQLKLVRARTGKYPENLQGLSEDAILKRHDWNPEERQLTPLDSFPLVLESGAAK